jgi:hypothetical protein
MTVGSAVQRSSTSDAGHAGFWRRHPVETGAALLLAAGAVGGVVLWAKWGFLVAFDAVVTYCFG